MKREKSCGAVVYRKTLKGYEFLIEKMVLGHYSLPKGHVESGEVEQATALREIKEETALSVTIRPDFKKTITYSPKECVIKDVVFFLAEATFSENISPQLTEVEKLFWLGYNEAIETLTHESDKDVLRRAYEFLKTTDQKVTK